MKLFVIEFKSPHFGLVKEARFSKNAKAAIAEFIQKVKRFPTIYSNPIRYSWVGASGKWIDVK